nr:hypothetical protein [Tanacetum cinerariifolium]GFA95786.1 hypothetical protein [Tanacetum cinerariifolium]
RHHYPAAAYTTAGTIYITTFLYIFVLFEFNKRKGHLFAVATAGEGDVAAEQQPRACLFRGHGCRAEAA